MAKKFFAALVMAAVMVLQACFAMAEHAVLPLESTEYYPDEENWTYCYEYRVPQLETGMTDVAAMMVNDTLVTALDEMRELVLPMFAASEEMTMNGQVTIRQDYKITCNNDHFFSIVITRTETDATGSFYSLDSEVFDVGGDYPGETLTLRGVVMVGESSDQISRAVMPVLYEKFVLLQEEGVCRRDITREDFEALCSPTLDYYADEMGNAVFFLQPSLMENPSLDVPTFTFTPDELAALCENVPAEAEE